MAKVDDRIEISVPARSLVKLSLLVYLMPIIGLLIGAYAGGAWASFFGIGSTPGSILGAVFGLGITFYFLKRFERSTQFKEKYAIRMTKIFPNADIRHDRS